MKTPKITQKNFLKQEMNELKIFIDQMMLIKSDASLNDGKPIGISWNELKEKGVSEGLLEKLTNFHFISRRNDVTPIWISWSNAYYPNRTIDNLKKIYKMYEKECKEE